MAPFRVKWSECGERLSRPVHEHSWVGRYDVREENSWQDVVGVRRHHQIDLQRKALALWLNSTFPILLYYGRRPISEGVWMQMKKQAWSSVPARDVRSPSPQQFRITIKGFDVTAERRLAPLAQLDSNPAWYRIDDVFCEALDLPDTSAIRELLAREPGLSAQEISAPHDDEEDAEP